MCGRYTLADPAMVNEAIRDFGAEPHDVPQRFNGAPSQLMPVVLHKAEGIQQVLFRWGIVPFFARKEPKPLQLINARSETAAEKPTFRQSVQRRRCVVPADGFFEWQRHPDGKSKTPFYIRLKGGRPFWIAALYEDESPPHPAGFVLLTTGPNSFMASIHDRMPVILDADEARSWISPGAIAPEAVHALCDSYPADRMEAAAVSSIVNNARNDVPECIVPVLT